MFAPLLNEDWEVALSAYYGLEGAPVHWKGMPLLPGLGGNFGAEYLPLHAAKWGKGDPSTITVLTLMDVWVLPHDFTQQVGGNLICWTPVDHDPAPPMVKDFFAASGAFPLAMSRFGQEQLSEWEAGYCPHGVDTEHFAPRDMESADDFFWVGMVSANKGRPSRKGFQYAYESFAKFLEKREDARLYVHSSLKAEWMQGEDLIALQDACGVPHDAVAYADQYRIHFDPFTPREMSGIYSAMNVLLNPCMGGGFEIAQLEAAACGIPTVTVDFTAMPESAGPSPWKIGGRRFWTGQKSWNLEADVDAMADALEECYSMPAKQKRALSRKMRKHAEKYDAKRVYTEHMRPTLQEAEKRFEARGASLLKDFEILEATKPETTGDGPSISVVVPWLDHPELAGDFWKALDGENTHEVIIVDNGSEEPIDTIGEELVIRNEGNTGILHALNLGMEAASGDAVLFLNNDIKLGEQGWLEAIRAQLKPGVVVGANVRVQAHTKVDGEIQPYLDGWCIAAMAEDLEKIGGWDESYEEPAYFADNDFCLRAKQAGMTFSAVNPPLIHLENTTAGPPVGNVQAVTERNYLKFADRVRSAQLEAASV